MEHLKASASPIPYSGDGWFDPLEAAVRFQVRAFIETMVEAELLAALGGRDRYQRKGAPKGYRNGHRDRQLVGTFGQQRVSLPRARLIEESGGEREWHSQTIRAYKRVTKQAEALIAQVYLAGTNTRRVRRALASLFGGAVSKDTVSRAWRKVQGDWAAWQARDLSQEDIVRLIVDGTGVKVRLDKRVTSIPLLVALGVRRDGQKVLLAVRNMGGETQAAWRSVLDDLLARGLKAPELLIVDGGKGLEAALASLWSDIAVQRCSVHKERNLLAHAPKHLHDEILGSLLSRAPRHRRRRQTRAGPASLAASKTLPPPSPSAGRSSPGTTPSTAMPGSRCSPPMMSIITGHRMCWLSADVPCKPPGPFTPNASSTAPRNPPRFPKPSGSTHPPLRQQEKRVSK